MERDKTRGGGSDLWSTLLSDASAATSASPFSTDKSVIVFGNDLSGKSTLVSKLQSSDNLHRGSALDFEVIDVVGEDIEESGLCRIWVVDGLLAYRGLLQFALPQTMLSHSLVLITVDMTQPWSIPETLEKWTTVLYEHINSLKVTSTLLSSLKQKRIDDFLAYIDPSDSKTDNKLALTKSSEESSKLNSEQLGSIALSENLGIPIIVVCTKCDYFESLEAEYDYREEQFDFIQHFLRLYCLKLGAGLIYTSMKESKNNEVLKKYILHQLYGFPFEISASVVDRDAVFVPSGWDSEKKISIIKDSLNKISVADPFSSVIIRPASTRIFSHDLKEQQVEDEQSFMSRAQTVLSKPPALSKSGTNDSTSLHSKLRSSQEPSINFSPTQKAKPDPTKTNANNEKMLANFFNSLLNKKPGASTVSVAHKNSRKSTDHQQNIKNTD